MSRKSAYPTAAPNSDTRTSTATSTGTYQVLSRYPSPDYPTPNYPHVNYSILLARSPCTDYHHSSQECTVSEALNLVFFTLIHAFIRSFSVRLKLVTLASRAFLARFV